MPVAASEPKVRVPRPAAPEEEQKLRCCCGKWWAYQSAGRFLLQCRRCRRQIVISGENLQIEYR